MEMAAQQGSPVVVLDPGHGGSVKVGGSSPNNAVGAGGLLEKDLTLDVATRTAALLANDARVILTRTSDVNLGLADRAEVASANGAAAFVSVHFNGFVDPSVDGTEVWVARAASAPSVSLAEAVRQRLLAVTQVRDRGVRRADMGVLLPSRVGADTAACLAEVAFLSNEGEARRLADTAYRQQVAEAIAAAIRDRLAAPASADGATTHALDLQSFLVDRLVQYFRNATSPDTPLDPGVGGQSIGEGALQIGDVIVSTTAHASSALIRFGTGSQVSHAKLYIGGGQVVEAIGQGVVLRSLAESLADDTTAVAFRYPGITNQQQLMVRDFAGRQLDLPYNYVGVVRLALFQIERTNCDVLPGDLQNACRNWVGRIVLGPGNSDTFFCSQLVLGAYADAGVPLTSTVPHWNSPEEIVDLSLTSHLAYVGHLKAPPATGMSLGWDQYAGLAKGGQERRRTAASIGGYGAPAHRGVGSALDVTVTLGYGVAGASIIDGFYRDATEKQAVTGRTSGRRTHLGIDVSTTNAHGGGADDPRRGLPVYAVVKRTIDISALNAVRAARNDEQLSGLGIDGTGSAELQNAVVLAQPWGTQDDSAYGGVVGLACHYAYTKTDGSRATFTLYVEYLHLITPTYLPKDGNGAVISAETWAATGKPIGFGSRITNGASLSADDLTAGEPVLVGYLGATQFPHVHIQAAYGPGDQRYLRVPRIDPAVMLRDTAATSLALAAGAPSLSLGDSSVSYDIPGTFEPLQQRTSMVCWATVATMLVSWRDQVSIPIEAVCDRAGPEYRRKYENNEGLPRDQKPDFLRRLDLEEEPPANYIISAYMGMLQAYGPLWVTTDVGTGQGYVAIHARIMTGLQGDGTPDGTYVWLVDPATGQRTQETFSHFASTFEQMARDVGATEPLWVQIVHPRRR